MDGRNRTSTNTPLKALKQLSITRNALEQQSETMSQELERLQRANAIQERRIDESLTDLHRSQTDTHRLLNSGANKSQCLDRLRNSSPHEKQLEDWSIAEVIQWLQTRNLHKFVFLFQKHHVSGKDLASLSLPFLDNYEHISVDERETLLSEIYRLLNPPALHVSTEDLSKIHSPIDRQKYFAAFELAQGQGYTLPRSSSVVVLPTQRTNSRSTSSSQSSPVAKPRHKSESGTESKFKVLSHRAVDTKKRKTMPKSHHKAASSVYDLVTSAGPHCITCVQLPQQPDGSAGITTVTNHEGHVIIDRVSDSIQGSLHSGDRVLEINGYMVHGMAKDQDFRIAAMVKCKSPAQLVILTHTHTQDPSHGDNGYTDDRWNTLQSMLIEMRDADIEPELDIPPLPMEQATYIESTSLLQGKITKLEDELKEHQETIDKQQAEIEDKAAIMHDLEISRNKAIEKLQQSRNRLRNTRAESIGGAEYYNMTMESLELETASKDKILETLKEIMTEASKQKWYLDRLISLVIEEIPWLLDEVDANYDTLTLTDQTEEFC